MLPPFPRVDASRDCCNHCAFSYCGIYEWQSPRDFGADVTRWQPVPWSVTCGIVVIAVCVNPGVLRKLSSSGNWQRRWFEIVSHYFVYYKVGGLRGVAWALMTAWGLCRDPTRAPFSICGDTVGERVLPPCCACAPLWMQTQESRQMLCALDLWTAERPVQGEEGKGSEEGTDCAQRHTILCRVATESCPPREAVSTPGRALLPVPDAVPRCCAMTCRCICRCV